MIIDGNIELVVGGNNSNSDGYQWLVLVDG